MVERKTVGKYTLLKRLGKGGMGTVYKALSPRIDKIVALKLLNPSEALEITLGYEKLEEIFLFEAQTLESPKHAKPASIAWKARSTCFRTAMSRFSGLINKSNGGKI